MVTGGTGFVGRYVVRELLSRGYTPVCVVRNRAKLFAQHALVDPSRLVPIEGDLFDRGALAEAAEESDAAIHLVGIILESRFARQTFDRVHRQGTVNVVDAVKSAGRKRYIHMSALGTRKEAVAAYHKTKWAAEEYVRQSDLDWTIFRPSVIHGPDGEFMQLMRQFVAGLTMPVIPYFGSGEARLQPVHVKDVAHCFVESLKREESIGQSYDLGGPRRYNWKELYNACRALIPGSKRWKPMVSQPVAIGKAIALITSVPLSLAAKVMPSLGLLRFNKGQVQMSQEDSICDHTLAEEAFGIRMRDFEEELASYADQIR